MAVQLVVANEQGKGKVVPVNVNSFMIGRGENCQLKSKSSQVSRNHCCIKIEGASITVEDLGSSNGVYVNDVRITQKTAVGDGDKLSVGPHIFTVQVLTDSRPLPQTNGFAALPDPSPTSSESSSTTALGDKTVIKEAPQPGQSSELMFEVRINDKKLSVPKEKLFELAATGQIKPDTSVTIGGMSVYADTIQGIQFGKPGQALPPKAKEQPAGNNASNSLTSDFPFGDALPFSDLPDGIKQPFVKVRRSSQQGSFKRLWNELDLTFSKMYASGDDTLVIHTVRALYYLLAVAGFLLILYVAVSIGILAYKAHPDWTQPIAGGIFPFSITTFGVFAFIVVIRVLIEICLRMAFEEESKKEQNAETEIKRD